MAKTRKRQREDLVDDLRHLSSALRQEASNELVNPYECGLSTPDGEALDLHHIADRVDQAIKLLD